MQHRGLNPMLGHLGDNGVSIRRVVIANARRMHVGVHDLVFNDRGSAPMQGMAGISRTPDKQRHHRDARAEQIG